MSWFFFHFTEFTINKNISEKLLEIVSLNMKKYIFFLPSSKINQIFSKTSAESHPSVPTKNHYIPIQISFNTHICQKWGKPHSQLKSLKKIFNWIGKWKTFHPGPVPCKTPSCDPGTAQPFKYSLPTGLLEGQWRFHSLDEEVTAPSGMAPLEGDLSFIVLQPRIGSGA